MRTKEYQEKMSEIDAKIADLDPKALQDRDRELLDEEISLVEFKSTFQGADVSERRAAITNERCAIAAKLQEVEELFKERDKLIVNFTGGGG